MQAVERGRGADAVSVELGAPAGGLQAQLDGFKSRAVRASALMQQQRQHAYVTDWRPIEQGASGTTAPAMVAPSQREATKRLKMTMKLVHGPRRGCVVRRKGLPRRQSIQGALKPEVLCGPRYAPCACISIAHYSTELAA